MKFVDALGNIKFGKALFFGNNIQMSETVDGVVSINAAVLSGTGSSLALLGDVVITSPQDDQFLRYSTSQTKWINQFIAAADIGPGTFQAGNYTFPGNTVLSGTANIYGNTTLNKNLTVSGTSIFQGQVNTNGNLIASGVNEFFGGFTFQQVGLSSTISRWPSTILIDNNAHIYSGTTEASLFSTTLKAQTMVLNGHTIHIKGFIQSAGAAGTFQIKVGNGTVFSGTIGASQSTWFDCHFWRTDSTHAWAHWTYNSGTIMGTAGSLNTTTPIIAFSSAIAPITWAVDNTLDFRGNNYLATNFNLTLAYIQITFENA